MFLNFAYINRSETSQIYCPFTKYANRVYEYRTTVNDHLEVFGFTKSYKTWNYHGDDFGGSYDNMYNLGDDIVGYDTPVHLGVPKTHICCTYRVFQLYQQLFRYSQIPYLIPLGTTPTVPKSFRNVYQLSPQFAFPKPCLKCFGMV
ncbi:Transpos_assoc domain-containing protein [Cephalotus follicularis]|uniref:Transpos_assoc domain-containing protein n=1 Tax=Cephalotus follicularis TaxID=3775 RepID=A0A1Q3AXF4_CEPFO|nr:Transpos_assoc domain-containing protein [Cephalotus follicularis]